MDPTEAIGGGPGGGVEEASFSDALSDAELVNVIEENLDTFVAPALVFYILLMPSEVTGQDLLSLA